MTIIKKVNLALAIYLLLYSPLTNAQQTEFKAKTLAEKLSNYFEAYPTERMYLDIDKSRYTSGDTIWFKSYLTAGFYNQPSPLSGVAYINLVTSSDSIISKAKIQINSGLGTGFINIPREVRSSNYQLIGYTKWMIDVDSTEIFHKNIPIVNLFEKTNNPKRDTITGNLSISFYPEGGNLVNGTESRVAYKLVGSLSQAEKLVLYSDRGDSIATIQNQFLGMGTFQLHADEGVRYYVKSILNDRKFYLPQSTNEEAGIFLINSESLSDIRFKIYKGEFSSYSEVIILAHINGLVTYAADASFAEDGTIIGRVPKNILGPGVNNLTVFTASGIPILERSVFIDKEATFDLSTKIDKTTYSNRSKVSTEISTMIKDAAVVADLSMSVVEVNQSWDIENEDNIISHFLLSSRLKGKVQKPWYYFNSNDEQRYQNADLLMMVNGWSRYNFKKYLNSSLGDVNPEASIEQGITIAGYLLKESGKKPIVDGSVNFIVQDSSSAIGMANTNKMGYFNIPDLKITGETPIVLKGKNAKGNDNVKFEMDSSSFQPIVYNKFNYQQEDQYLKIDQDELTNSLKFQETLRGQNLENNFEMLEEVSVRSFKIDEQQKVNNLFGKGSYTLKAEDLVISQTAQHPLELIRGRVPGVRVSGNLNSWTILIQGVGSINSGTTPLILVDNLEVNIDFLNSLPASQIKQVEVYKGASAAIFGSRGANGALAFFTKNGVQDYTDYDLESVEVVILEGYQIHKEFYSVSYNEDRNSKVADYRTVLTWEPLIQTTTEGKYQTTFYTSDVDGDYILVIEGMTKAGTLGFQTLEFSVK